MDRDRALDQVKTAAFFDSNAAFLGCLMCNLNFQWSTAISTAGVSEKEFLWNPDWFDSLTKEERKGVLMHELWHIALLHGLRKQDREDERWNIACDVRINENLLKEGYVLPDGACTNSYFRDPDWTEEEIYEQLPANQSPQTWGCEVFDNSSDQVALVQEAMAAAKIAGQDPGKVQEILHDFLKPKLNWRQILHNYLLDKIEPEWSWNRPNKRFSDIYLPSILPQDGRLITIAMFLDTSGSISDEDQKRFTSEVKFVQEVLNPEKLYVVQFDTIIQDEHIYNESTRFKNINIKGRGGTDYECIRQYILKHKPTVSIIFTDLYADEMESVGKNKLIWIVKDNDDNASQGETIHVD